ncbi:MAG: type IV pilus twitching motility protein PilT [Deltaproteobacteria bacterium]|nr:type IV pilus twitching motility protein PilT [Deltaproteobacteria bacterium]MBI2227512.1 type IV pilus twitching motility protein PilT [Deltaproteobacteria bacterium]MBI2535328.1 type IV pilus twitching motility protein PilT [Deltaproteobacteria bacterium]
MEISQLLVFGVEQNASDCHLSAGEPPMLRVDGEIKKLDLPPLSQEEVHGLVFDIMSDVQRKTFQESLECDFSFELKGLARFRVNVFMQRNGEAAVFRTIPTKILSLEALGMPLILKQLCEKKKGLILVTGPTGCGKSTTLAAMVDYLNNNFEGHILTIEDPIEFVHQSKKCLINQRELGPHTHSFANALRSALREDPDAILVGELRDLETIQLALTAAETGHIVFGTLHTSSAPKSVDRVIDVFPAAQQAQIRTQFAESIEGVITQKLLKKKTGGRIAALEIMTGTTAIRNLIREGKIHQIPGTIQVSQKDGMQSLDMALQSLVARDLVTREEAQSKSMTANLFGPSAAAAGR